MLLAYLAWDFFPSRQIPLKPDNCWGLPCLRAKQMVIQEMDPEGRIWATRGLWAYSKTEHDNAFFRRFHIPTGVSLAWLNNFTLVRWLTGRDNCVELVNLPGGGVMAQSGPCIWLRDGPDSSWRKSHTLAHYGFGVGRGLMPSGMAALPDGTLLFGEYWRNPTQNAVNIYRHRPSDTDWCPFYTFPEHQVRHIHAVQPDPYEPKTWVATGDSKSEPRLAWTDDDACTLHVVGCGESSGAGQKWRICQLVFTPDALYWGADTESSESGIYKYDRLTGSLTNLAYVPGAVWYGTRLNDGTIIMSSAVENYPNEIDKLTRLWVIDMTNQVKNMPLGAWVRPKLFGGYAWLRLPRNQGAKDLYMTCLNVSEFNGDLLVIEPAILESKSMALSAGMRTPRGQ
jgi:hypothetical protein